MSAAMLLKLPYFLYKRYQLMNGSDTYWKKKVGNSALIVDGRTLNPRAQSLIALQGKFSPHVEQWTVPMLRGGYNKSMELFDGPKHPITKIEDLRIDLEGRDLKARLYDPAPEKTNRPMMMYFHGGGFVIGGLESHDRFCRKIALQSGYPVLAVDYRLGPENRFPAAMLDALDSWDWLIRNADRFSVNTDQLIVGGDSAGAALSLLVMGEAAKGRFSAKPATNILIYPAMMDAPETKSRQLLGDKDIVLNKDLLDWFMGNFLDASQTEYEDLLAPLNGCERGNIAPTWIRTCGFDPLRDEGEMIAHDLEALGTEIDLKEYEDLYHGFIGVSAILPDVDRMIADMTAFMKAKIALSGNSKKAA